jgi:hypothetical protein
VRKFGGISCTLVLKDLPPVDAYSSKSSVLSESEKEIRLQILAEARDLDGRGGLCYPRSEPVVNDVAGDLIEERLVTGTKDRGTAVISGIRDAGLRELKNAEPHRRVLRKFQKLFFVVYSMTLLAVGYVLNLDSVKKYFSDLFERILR